MQKPITPILPVQSSRYAPAHASVLVRRAALVVAITDPLDQEELLGFSMDTSTAPVCIGASRGPSMT